MMMIDFLSMRINSARYDVDVIVVRVMVRVDKHRLPGLPISHFFHVLMGDSHQFLFCIFMAFT